MSPADAETAQWWQQDARYLYAIATQHRDAPGPGPWLAVKVQEAAAWSSAHARAILCGTPPPVA